MNELFPTEELDINISNQPLAERLRPKCLDDVVGQDHLLNEDGFITRCIKANKPASIVLWGSPGCGKTTIARLYAKAFGAHFEQISAVFSGVADLKKVVAGAKDRQHTGQTTLLFVDEIHRFNKSQQDAFLPFVEDGTIILVGATTENPSFKLNAALLSRVQVLTLNQLKNAPLEAILTKAEDEIGKLPVNEKARSYLIEMASGDGRYLLSLAETINNTVGEDEKLDVPELANLLQKRKANHDVEQHYDLISALHKSVRGSDPDASLYWFARMLEGGDDPLFLARRLIRMAVEDIGMADPNALTQTIAARQAYETMGSPEGELALAQSVVYLALAPKSNAVYNAFNSVMKRAGQTGNLGPPMVIRNAPTKVMSELGYGEGYQYDHDTTNCFSGQNYFPDDMERETYYKPVSRGFERDMVKRVNYFNKLREDINK